jgi:hypothetical protein
MSFTSRNGLIMPNPTTQRWGSQGVTESIALIDQMLDGVATGVNGLPAFRNGAPADARCRTLRISGDVILTNRQKWYLIINTTDAVRTITFGTSAVDIGPLESVPVVNDGQFLWRMDGASPAGSPIVSVQYPRVVTPEDADTTLSMLDSATLSLPALATVPNLFTVAFKNNTLIDQEIPAIGGDTIFPLDYEALVLGGQDGTLVEAQDGSWIGDVVGIGYVFLPPGGSARVVSNGTSWIELR